VQRFYNWGVIEAKYLKLINMALAVDSEKDASAGEAGA